MHFHKHGRGTNILGNNDVSLSDQLCECWTNSKLNNHDFIPADCLKVLLAEEHIKEELERAVVNHNGLASFIRNQAPKTFLILVSLDKTAAIEKFHSYGFTDHHLPIDIRRHGQDQVIDDNLKTIDVPVISLSNNHNADESFYKALLVFKEWRSADIHKFCKEQWGFLSPVISDDMCCHGPLHPKIILPFDKKGEEKISNFSKVSSFRIHPAHRPKGKDSWNGWIALKEPKDIANADPKDRDEILKMFRQEAENLKLLREHHHPHLIELLASFEFGNVPYFIFPWADKGNLRDFWANNDPRDTNIGVVDWAIDQLYGLFDGLTLMHKINCRHGDLKPENILIYKEQRTQERLVIADFGLAKVHSQKTALRIERTGTMSGTQRYEPPETHEPGPRSRAYDVWSMGCISLEFIIWLLEGSQGLKAFNRLNQFWEVELKESGESQSNQPTVPPNVSTKVQTLRMNQRCTEGTVMRDFLALVEGRMLRVACKERDGANELLQALDGIRSKTDQNPNHLLTNTGLQPHRPIQHFSGNTLRPQSSRMNSQHLGGGLVVVNPLNPSTTDDTKDIRFDFSAPQPENDRGNVREDVQDSGTDDSAEDQMMHLNDTWETVPSDNFARRLFALIDIHAVIPTVTEAAKLCERCSSMDIWSPYFSTSDDVNELKDRHPSCQLCSIFYHCAEESGRTKGATIELYRVESTFRFDRHGPVVLSIYTIPEFKHVSPYVQIGFPKLPPAGSQTEFVLLREWLRLCDDPENHACHPTLEGPLPKRVLYVGDVGGLKTLYLHCPASDERGRYVALSHRWGDPHYHPPFSTKRSNIFKFRKFIVFEQLPKTFQDAVTVTRELGISYLWIDSLCIVQDDEDDWDHQSKLMADVFTFAYCTIAASCARGSSDGFLRPRAPRKIVAVTTKSGETYYVCQAIDNFRKDVEEGSLNHRGWVLQERALSHRTIYFTDTQIYWECGDGVHCETLTKMRNNKSHFFGDSEFPKSAERLRKGGKIRLYEEVYKRYSRLEFTRITDRSVAIRGLEKKLVSAFGTVGGFGIFQQYLGRSLLWQRASNEMMQMIEYSPPRKVPSWSWMAYDGRITYVDIPFGKVEWMQKEIQSPFRGGVQYYTSSGSTNYKNLPSPELIAIARHLSPRSSAGGLSSIVFDTQDRTNSQGLKCVVFARDKSPNLGKVQKYYVLAIIPKSLSDEEGIYLRGGAGFVEKCQIDFGTPGIKVLIR